MHIHIQTTPEEVGRARKWFSELDMLWQMAFNEVLFRKGPTMEPPTDEHLMFLVLGVENVRFAGPAAHYPNMSFQLKDLSGLIPLRQLKHITLCNHQVTRLAALAQHTALEHLYVMENQLTSLEGVERMTHLKNLYCQGNQIKSLSPIRNLTNLEVLYVTRNQLHDLDGLTVAHKAQLKTFRVMPNNTLPDEAIIKCQQELGIICSRG
jgi:hypothetical protein